MPEPELTFATLDLAFPAGYMLAGAIWDSFALAPGPLYLLGVMSRRVNGRVIWCGTTVCWDATTDMILWYAWSKSGITGPIPVTWWLHASEFIQRGDYGRAVLSIAGLDTAARDETPRRLYGFL